MDLRHHTKGSKFWSWTGWGYTVTPSLTLNKFLKYPKPPRIPRARPLLRHRALCPDALPLYQECRSRRSRARPSWRDLRVGPFLLPQPCSTPPSTRPPGPLPSCPLQHRASLELLLTDTSFPSTQQSHQQLNTNQFLPLLSCLHIGLWFPLCPSAPFLGNYSKEGSLPRLQFSLKGAPEPTCCTVHAPVVTGPPAAAPTTAPSPPPARLPSASGAAAPPGAPLPRAAPQPLRGTLDQLLGLYFYLRTSF